MTEPIDNSKVKDLDKANANEIDISKLTAQNWLFINSFIETRSIKKAYALAKYEGKDDSAPYQLFKKLKPYIEQLGDLDVTSRARLQADLRSVLDLPLNEDKKSLTLSEWLRVRKFAAAITPEAASSKPNISVIVINRPANKRVDAGINGAEIIDVSGDSSKVPGKVDKPI